MSLSIVKGSFSSTSMQAKKYHFLSFCYLILNSKVLKSPTLLFIIMRYHKPLIPTLLFIIMKYHKPLISTINSDYVHVMCYYVIINNDNTSLIVFIEERMFVSDLCPLFDLRNFLFVVLMLTYGPMSESYVTNSPQRPH